MSWRISLIGLFFLFSVSHEAFPDYVEGMALYDFFPFYDIKLTPQTYFYFMFETIGRIVLSYIIAIDETKLKVPMRCFFWLQVADLVDYLLTYNTTWVHISWIPVSMNTVSICIFAYVAWRYGRIDSD